MDIIASLERTLDTALAARATSLLTERDRAVAKRASVKNISGFAVTSASAEREALDMLLAARKDAVEHFQKMRKAARDSLYQLGVTPLATLPTQVWDELMLRAGLYRLRPDKNGRVRASGGLSWSAYPAALRPVPGIGMAEAIARFDDWAEANWPSVIQRLFPAMDVAPAGDTASPLTLVLPEPPPEVGAIIAKMGGRKLTIAAVAAAIRFSVPLSQLLVAEAQRQEALKAEAIRQAALRAEEQARRDERAAAERARLLADPIIYMEGDGVVAILAQFGDFPIEKAVVQSVIESDALIPDGPLGVNPAQYSSMGEVYAKVLAQ